MGSSILQEVAAGSPQAVDACLRRYRQPVWGLALRYAPSAADVEDAVQEVFIDLWRSAVRFDPELGSELTFVMTVARRRLIDRCRRSGRGPLMRGLPGGDEVVAADEPDRIELADEVERALQALEKLRPEQRRVLQMSLLQGHSHQQVAERTGMPLGTVKSHVRRGLRRIRDLLGVPEPAGGGDE